MTHQLSFSFMQPSRKDRPSARNEEQLHSIEDRFDTTFVAALASKEKQIQQSYRPVIGIHKWFARRPGTVFRNLLLAEFNGEESLHRDYWRSHQFEGVIADPFMGGGTPIFEANRLGFSVVGADINPMAFWIVRQSLAPLDLVRFRRSAEAVIHDVEQELQDLFNTTCTECGTKATAKYFLWVKTQTCPSCGGENDLFPGYLLAEAVRHPRHVVVCHHCGSLNEFDHQPRKDHPEPCSKCNKDVYIDGPAKKNRVACSSCGQVFSYPAKEPYGPPKHRMWAIEYHCEHCKPGHRGRFFKTPDVDDLRRYRDAEQRFREVAPQLPIPEDAIPEGDETNRLHRWGYRHFRDMFNDRQLLGLGLLLRRISQVGDSSARHALLTVFSDFLRYQNMLGRYDTYALKCQDIFSVHGFPVGLVQCENNLLGIPRVGSGAFRHFLEKYRRAKEYCQHPFETRYKGTRKQIVPIEGERLEAHLVSRFPRAGRREAWINCSSAETVPLPVNSLDGVFTDPPYFDNVQYAELMDFCYVWLRTALADEVSAFQAPTTRTPAELTGNESMGRGLEHFTAGLSSVFQHYAAALKAGAPFVFTFHHNDPQAYVPIVVAILDAGLDCTATLPAPAEMGASLHIARTKSSVLDSIFVCRRITVGPRSMTLREHVDRDLSGLESAGLELSKGDIRCILAGHVARIAINRLWAKWDAAQPLPQRMATANLALTEVSELVDVETLLPERTDETAARKSGEDARSAAI
ncbi:MAG: DNA methylase [Desulfomonile tiedjei]|nr:DNA methylase [Desulfomonile tiedjei]